MADYNLLRDRVDLYVEKTGLSRTAVNAFRKTPVNEWTRLSDRRIGRAIRGLERLWSDPELTVAQWTRAARGILRVIADFLNDVISTVEQLAGRLADAISRAMDWVEQTASRVQRFARKYPRVWKVLVWLGGQAVSALRKNYTKQLPASV
jgi:hypothetical protein